jgi:hypothetical protein
LVHAFFKLIKKKLTRERKKANKSLVLKCKRVWWVEQFPYPNRRLPNLPHTWDRFAGLEGLGFQEKGVVALKSIVKNSLPYKYNILQIYQ